MIVFVVDVSDAIIKYSWDVPSPLVCRVKLRVTWTTHWDFLMVRWKISLDHLPRLWSPSHRVLCILCSLYFKYDISCNINTHELSIQILENMVIKKSNWFIRFHVKYKLWLRQEKYVNTQLKFKTKYIEILSYKKQKINYTYNIFFWIELKTFFQNVTLQTV